MRFSKFVRRAAILSLFSGVTAQAALVDLTDIVEIAAGVNHACAINATGGLKCWGGNATGQLGDGTTLSRSVAGDVAGLSTGVVAIALSHSGMVWRDYYGAHSCAITQGGGVKCWGQNDSGQLGDGTTTQRLVPVDVPGLSGAVGLALGERHTCAVLSSGAVKCWGQNDAGQLGDGTHTSRLFPVDVAGLSGVVQVTAAWRHSCALTAAGGAYCWGSNEAGQLGDGTNLPRTTPVGVQSLSSGVASISAGGDSVQAAQYMISSCALTTSGGVKCWGQINQSYTPFDVSGLTSGVASLSMGGGRTGNGYSAGTYAMGHACVVTSAGGAKCWGYDYCGTLGGGGPVGQCMHGMQNYTQVVDVVGHFSGVAEVAAGGGFSCALTAAGKVNCWGGIYDTQPVPIKTGTAPQTITIGSISGPVPVGGSGVMSTTASSGLPVTFTSLSPGICSVSGSTIYGLAQGWCMLAADQAGNAFNEPAPRVTFQIPIGAPANQTITFGGAPAVAVGTVGTLNATASSGLAVSFFSNTPGVCTVSGSTVTGVSVGNCTVTATQSGDALYSPAPQVTQTFAVSANAGSYSLVVAKWGQGTGAVSSSPAGINCGSTCTANFSSATLIALTATPAAGSFFTGWSGGCTGSGACNVTMNGAATVTATFGSASTIPRLVNIATRGLVLTGDDVMIAGFIIGGSAPKTVVVNVAGPTLANHGITNALANPRLLLVRSSDGAIIASNEDWQGAANAAQIQASGFAPANALEPAIMMTLQPGAYTAVVQGSGTGVALVGLFEVDKPEVPLINISTRGMVQGGNNVMIAGFIIQGANPKTVVVNVAGPSLANYGISNSLANPKLTLVRSSDGAVIATNDNWQADPDYIGIQASGFAPAHPLESAIRMTLPPGAYTAIVEGVGGGTGVALVGVFAVQ